MNSLEVHNLHKSFGKNKILDNVALKCHTNSILGIFGRNGCGKSTMLKCIFGTLNADSISIKINQESIPSKKIITSKKIAYLPQQSFLPRNSRVSDLIQLYFKNPERQDNIFYAPRIQKITRKKVYQLSLGERRYLELVLVAFLDHPFILLDEPFSMIEPLYKDLIADFLKDLKNEKGIIVTDHYYTDVLNITDENMILKEKKLISFNTVEDLKEHGYIV